MSSFSFNGADSTVVVNWPKTEMVIRLLQFFALLVWRFELVACVGGDFISHISAKHIHVHSYSSRFFPIMACVQRQEAAVQIVSLDESPYKKIKKVQIF